jgi:tRNA (guanine37-N1)-methyltransferase
MRAPGFRVSRTRGEEVRRRLADLGLLRADLEILKEDDHLVLPLVSAEPAGLRDGVVVVRDFGQIAPSGPTDYRELLDWPAGAKATLPRSFDVIGDIVLIRLPDDLVGRQDEIGEALLSFVPTARVVGRDRGVHGPERRRQVERIAGTGGWRTRHRENGLDFEVNVERAYFSPRLAREHARVADEVRTGERVYDLCCGVGPFAVTIARDGRASSVTAVDSNPEAIELLQATLARYPFGARVRPVLARLESFLPSSTAVDRVILNLPHEGIKYLPSVARAVAPRGRLHYYEVTPRVESERRAEAVVGALGSVGWKLVDRHPVHPYSPASDLVASVFERTEG